MEKITLRPIAFVKNERLVPEDDNWDAVESIIELTPEITEAALDGIETYSHLEIIYYFHQVPEEKAVARSRHPRNNKDWPVVGTYAQRNKSRPNLLGATIVELVKREGNQLMVKKLDAINGTPVLDIKPIMQEFMPQTTIKQPDWSSALMKNYWNTTS